MIIRKRFTKIRNHLVSLQEEFKEEMGELDDYCVNTFERLFDELISLEVYREERCGKREPVLKNSQTSTKDDKPSQKDLELNSMNFTPIILLKTLIKRQLNYSLEEMIIGGLIGVAGLRNYESR